MKPPREQNIFVCLTTTATTTESRAMICTSKMHIGPPVAKVTVHSKAVVLLVVLS